MQKFSNLSPLFLWTPRLCNPITYLSKLLLEFTLEFRSPITLTISNFMKLVESLFHLGQILEETDSWSFECTLLSSVTVFLRIPIYYHQPFQSTNTQCAERDMSTIQSSIISPHFGRKCLVYIAGTLEESDTVAKEPKIIDFNNPQNAIPFNHL